MCNGLRFIFEYKITFWICVLTFLIHKGYFVIKTLVLNVRFKCLLVYKENKMLTAKNMNLAFLKFRESCM